MDDAAPGNYGLWDAVVSLEWVNENIGFFGSGTDRITIIGQSAGAAVASYLLYAPAAEDLFHRWANSFLAATSARDLADFALCPTNDTEEMMQCLLQKTPMRLT